jgi:HK97 gp10 family phage protein
MPDELLEKLSRLGAESDAIAERVLEVGGDIVVSKVKSNLSAVIGSGVKFDSRSTGELERSLGVSPVKIDKYGNSNIKIGFTEPRSDNESNAKIANIIEYGKSGQPAKPFLKPAKSATKTACMNAMKQKLEQEVKNV